MRSSSGIRHVRPAVAGGRVGNRILRLVSDGGGVRDTGSLNKSSSVVCAGNSQSPGRGFDIRLGEDRRDWDLVGGSDHGRAEDCSGAILEGDGLSQGSTGGGDIVRNLDSGGAILLGHRLGLDRSNRPVNSNRRRLVGDIDFDRSDCLLTSSGDEVRDLDGPGDIVRRSHRLGFNRSDCPVDSNRRRLVRDVDFDGSDRVVDGNRLRVLGESDSAVTQVHDLRGDNSLNCCRRVATVDQSVARRSSRGDVLVRRSRSLRHRHDAARRSNTGRRVVVAD